MPYPYYNEPFFEDEQYALLSSSSSFTPILYPRPLVRFKDTQTIGNVSIDEALYDNLHFYLDWCFLNIGAFYNISIPSSGNIHLLQQSSDPRFTVGTVWEARRGNWVWETDLDYHIQPIEIDGIYLNNTFLPMNSGYHLDYVNGRVVFDTPQSSNTEVAMSYSFRWVNVTNSASIPWFRTIQENSLIHNRTKLPEVKIQLPCVAIEISTDKNYKPYALGGGLIAHSKVVFHVLAEDYFSATRTADILSRQRGSTLKVFNPDIAQYPLNLKGSLRDEAVLYPNMLLKYSEGGFLYSDKIQNGTIYIEDVKSRAGYAISDNIYHAPVTWNIESILHKN